MRNAIHTIIIDTMGAQPADVEGRGGWGVVATTTVKGHFVVEHTPEEEAGERYTEQIIGTAYLPTTYAGRPTQVFAKDRLTLQEGQPTLDGQYEVTGVEYTPLVILAHARRSGV